MSGKSTIIILNMSTQIIILGKTLKKKLTPISFERVFNIIKGEMNLEVVCGDPSGFKYIELICNNYQGEGVDLMFAYDNADKRSEGVFYTGQFNDGVIE